MAEVTDHSGDQNTNSNTQDIKNFGVPPMVVYILSAFILLLFMVMFLSVGKVGQLAAEVQTLQHQVKDLDTAIKVAEIVKANRLEDELRQENINLTAKLNGETP